MIDIEKLLFEICEDEKVYDKNIDLIDSDLLDSYSMIILFSKLEDLGITIYPTRIDRDLLRSVDGIKKLIEEAQK